MTETEGAPNPGRPRLVAGRPRWQLYAAAACGLALVGLSAAVALAIASRPPDGREVSSTVIPARTEQQAGATAAPDQPQAQAGSAPASAEQGDRAQAGPASTIPYPYPYMIGSCSTSPTVQFQGRGLAATGTAVVSPSAGSATTLSVSIQERGSDAVSVLAAVNAKLAGLRDALARVGVPAASIQQTSVSSYGDALRRQFTASAFLQAHLAGNDQVSEATRAVLQVGGITSYSTTSTLVGQPSSADVQSAVSAAAGQARAMAGAAADAADVDLGSVVSLVTQPPVICSGPGGPVRLVQVTVTYALR